ncbi:MAG TPA: hypothetical protein DIC42_03350, partial [Holosporales bacterium]|nr:hypothetical protein [Holosporales bacterium]
PVVSEAASETGTVQEKTKQQRIDEFNAKADKVANSLIDFLTPKSTRGTATKGMGIEDLVKGATAAIKKAYAISQNIQEAVEAGIKYFKDNWTESELGELPEQALRDKLTTDLEGEVQPSIKEIAEQIRKEELNYNDAIEGKSETFINELNQELFGSKKVNFDTDAFKAQVRKQKSFGLTEAEVIEGFEVAKKLTKIQKGLIAEIFAETAETDKIAAELKEAFKALAKGEKPKSVLKRLGVSNVTELVNALKDSLTYNAVSNDQLDAMADFIVDSIDLNKAGQYINALVNNSVADVRQILRAKLIVALQKEGNTELATKLIKEMADEATVSGRQTQSLKRAYEILGAQGNPATRTEFARRYAEAVQEKATQMTQDLGNVISEQEAEIGKLNEKIHRQAQSSPSFVSKIKEVISNLCGLRNKK